MSPRGGLSSGGWSRVLLMYSAMSRLVLVVADQLWELPEIVGVYICSLRDGRCSQESMLLYNITSEIRSL